MPQHTYADDVDFLKDYTHVIELSAADGASVAVAPQYQGRIMTSTLGGEGAGGFGWLDRPYIERRTDDDPIFNNYGGEDRFWLGPEAGQFGLFFDPGDPFELKHTRTPRGFGSGPFEVAEQTSSSVTMTKHFQLINYGGAEFDCTVERTVNAIAPGRLAELLGAELLDISVGVEWPLLAVPLAVDNRIVRSADEPVPL